MAAYTGVGPAVGAYENSSLLSADNYALLRQITGAYDIFMDVDFVRGGLTDFMYKTGSMKDTPTRDIWHFEKGSIIPTATLTGSVTDNGGGSYSFATTAITNGTYSYNSAENVNQVPPGKGAIFSPFQIGDVLIARNGTLRATVTAKPSANNITVKVGSDNTTSWAALTAGDYIYTPFNTVGELDLFVPGNSQTKNRFGVTMQTIRVSTPKASMAALSQARSYTIAGSEFEGPEYLQDMMTNIAVKEAYATILGTGQTYTYTPAGGNDETRQELLGIVRAAETLGNDNGTIAINATTMIAISNYNFQNQGGRVLGIWQGGEMQTAVGAFFRNPANGFVNGGLDFSMKLPGGEKIKAVDMDIDAYKINNTTFLLGTALEFNNPRVTAGPYNASSTTDVYKKMGIAFPMTDDYATIPNSTLTSGTKVTSTPFGFNMYWYVQRDFEGRQVGTGRMQEWQQGPRELGAAAYMNTAQGTMLNQYIAPAKLQKLSV